MVLRVELCLTEGKEQHELTHNGEDKLPRGYLLGEAKERSPVA
jgi:hypothetical protein